MLRELFTSNYFKQHTEVCQGVRDIVALVAKYACLVIFLWSRLEEALAVAGRGGLRGPACRRPGAERGRPGGSILPPHALPLFLLCIQGSLILLEGLPQLSVFVKDQFI